MKNKFEHIDWNERSHLASRFIKPTDKILDLGAGKENLKKFIKCSSYTPIDFIKYTDNTIVADFNKKQYPKLSDGHVVMVLGVLEYLKDVKSFLKNIKQYGNKLIVTYYQAKKPMKLWINNFKYVDIIRFLNEAGWTIKHIDSIKRTKELLFVCERDA